MRQFLIASALTVSFCLSALLAQAQDLTPSQIETVQKLDAAAEVCGAAAGKPREVLADLAPRAGFTLETSFDWWEWAPSSIGPAIIVSRLPDSCRIGMPLTGLTRQQVVNAVVAWAERSDFTAIRQPPPSDAANGSLLRGSNGTLRLSLWNSNNQLVLGFTVI